MFWTFSLDIYDAPCDELQLLRDSGLFKVMNKNIHNCVFMFSAVGEIWSLQLAYNKWYSWYMLEKKSHAAFQCVFNVLWIFRLFIYCFSALIHTIIILFYILFWNNKHFFNIIIYLRIIASLLLLGWNRS